VRILCGVSGSFTVSPGRGLGRLLDELGIGLDPDSLGNRDPTLIARVLPALRWFNTRYLSLSCTGVEHIPAGPVLFVANHNGGIMGPDLFCTLGVLWETLGSSSPLYALAHDFAMRQLTPLGRQLARVGAIRACRENALRVLDSGGSALVYPGGDLDAYRHFRRRNEIVIAPRTGFVEIARRAGVPIVPIVAHGAHRSGFIFTEGEDLARRLNLRRWARLDRFPIALALPWIIAPGPWLPYLPLPLPVTLQILPPISPSEVSDAREGALLVQSRMQAALDEMAA